MVTSSLMSVDMLVEIEFMVESFCTSNVSAFQLRFFVNLPVPAEMNLCSEKLSANFCSQDFQLESTDFFQQAKTYHKECPSQCADTLRVLEVLAL